MNIPAAENIYQTVYSDFKGVDFTSQICTLNRFPKGRNFIISDMVEKRPGYKTVKSFENQINGLFCTLIDNVEYYIIHSGSNLFSMTSFESEPNLLLSDIKDGKSSGFYADGYYYILTGEEYIRTDGKTAQVINYHVYSYPFEVTDFKSTHTNQTYFPSMRYDAPIEDMLTCEIRTFANIECEYESTVEYFYKNKEDLMEMTYDEVMAGKFNKLRNRNLLCGWSSVRYSSFDIRVSSDMMIRGYLLPENSAEQARCIFIYSDGKCEITEGKSFYTYDDKRINYVESRVTDLNRDKDGEPFTILYETNTTDSQVYKCSASTFIQYGNGVYFFFTGNDKEPNKDWQSALNDPTYIPSDNYSIYGAEDEILGYGQYGENVAVFKKGNVDNNIYLKSAQHIDGLGVTFPTSVGVGGAIGGISGHTIKNLNGETLFLTHEGVYALTSLSLTNMKVTRNRSYFIDGLLLKEENLHNAIATVWKNKYILCVNSHCYILDGGQPLTYREGSNNDYIYECLYWDNIPASCFMTDENSLYFGTVTGEICVFTEGIYQDKDNPVDMMIATKLDDDGNYMSLKKMKKKGTGLLVKPYIKSSFDISFVYDNYDNSFVKKAYADIFDFDNIDFERFTFETSQNPRVIPFLKKSRKYKSMQIVLRSNNNEPFGFMSIIKRYTFNNYVKRS